ncbi:hypothetical protein S83_035226 [Arachis hypogaea]
MYRLLDPSDVTFDRRTTIVGNSALRVLELRGGSFRQGRKLTPGDRSLPSIIFYFKKVTKEWNHIRSKNIKMNFRRKSFLLFSMILLVLPLLLLLV